MDGLPSWAWLLVVVGVLLSPVFAFLIAICVEIAICLVKEGGVPALLVIVGASVIGRMLFSRLCLRRRPSHLAHDQA
jgi:hypothetical protein